MVQIAPNIRHRNTNVVLEHGTRGVRKPLLKEINQLALGEYISASEGKRVEAFRKRDLNVSRLDLGGHNCFVFCEEIVRHET